jgi:5-methylcytosine-specific restriction endonuclease McrA
MENARDLASRLADLLHREHAAMADFLVALADFDRQRLWVGLGYTSLYYFLHRELRLSAGAAFHRKTAAELIQRFPGVVEPLRDGRLCLSSVVGLSKVMTAENMAELLPRFFHASKQEAKALVAEIAPRDVLPQRVVVTTLVPLSQPRATTGVAFAPAAQASSSLPGLEPHQSLHPGETEGAPAAEAAPATPPARPSTPPRSTVEPLTADLRRLHVTVSKRFLEKLEAARDALSHSHPGADGEAILEAGLDLLLERAAKRKGLVKRPREAGGAAPPVSTPLTLTPERRAESNGIAGPRSPRYIPAQVRREVWLRDGGRCQWPTSDGGICGSTCRVQFDHIVPVARGGRSTPGNLRLTCAVHNALAARQVLGDACMDRFTRAASRPPAAGALD